MLNKMLRATLTKLKKVCFDSWTPRIFRGDYYIPVSATTLTRVHKSTDSGKGSQDDDEKCKRLIDELFNTKLEGIKIPEDPTTDLNIRDLKKEQVSQITSPEDVTPQETQCEICERLISQAFGKEGDDKLPNDAIVTATTDKQTEEQLEQKVEAFDETPLVEAAEPKIEGFNVNPKVLGDKEETRLKTLNFDNNKENDGVPATVIDEKTNNDLEELCQKIERGNRFYHAGKNLYQMPEFNPFEKRNPLDPTSTGMTYVNHPYDDIAKRCIDIPPNKIDRHILRELQRLGVPNSGGYGSNSDNTGNVDDLSRQMNNFNLQRGNSNNSPPDTQVLNPPYENEQLKVERPMIYELDKRPLPLCMMEQNVVDDTLITLASVGPKPDFNPNRMILDPFDKKSLCYDCVDPEYEVLSSYNVHVLVQRLENKDYHEQNSREQTEYLQTNQTYAGQSEQANYPGQSEQANYPGQSEQANYSVQSEQANYPGQSEQTNYPGQSEQANYPVQSEQANYAQQSEQINYSEQSPQSNYAQHSDHQTQSAEQLQVKPEYQGYEIKPLHESPRLPEKPINLCNENNTIHPANREEHYSMDRFEESERRHHQMNYQENMVPNPKHQQPEQEYVSKPENYQSQQHITFNSDYQNQQNYYGNRFQGGEQNQMIPNESSPKVDLPNEQQYYTNAPAVHVFTNAATNKSDKTSETLETILAHRENITAEEVADDIKHQTSKQVTDISDNTAPEQSRQLNFNEQSQAQHVQFQPTENDQPTEQEHLGRPIVPMHVSINDHCDLFDLRREPIEQTHQEKIDKKAHTLGSVKADPDQLDLKEQKLPIENLKVLGSVKSHPEPLDKKEQNILGAMKANIEQFDKKAQIAEQVHILGSVKTDPEQVDLKGQKLPNEQLDKKAHVLGSVNADPDQLDLKEQKLPIENLKVLGSVKSHPETLDKKEQNILGAMKTDIEQFDKKAQKAEQVLGSVKADPDQVDLKEQKLPNEQLKILSATKAHPEQKEKSIEHAKNDPVDKSEILAGAKVLGSVVAHQENLKDKKEVPIEHSAVLASVSARQERLDLKKQAIEQLKILDIAKVNPEEIDKKVQAIDQVRLISSDKPQKQDDLKQQTAEEAQVFNAVKIQEASVEKEQIAEANKLGAVQADTEILDLKEQKLPIEHLRILDSVKTYPEPLDKKEKRAGRPHILVSVKTDLEPLDKKEQPVKTHILASMKAHSDQKKEQLADANKLGAVNAHPEKLDLKEQKQPIEQHKILSAAKAYSEQNEKSIEHAKEDPVEKSEVLTGAKVLGSVVAHQEELKDKREEPIEHSEVLSSVSARQERPDFKKQATEQLKILDTAKINPENIEKKQQAIDHVRLQSSVKPQKQDDLKDQTTEEAQVLSTVKIQETPVEKKQRAEANILGAVNAHPEKLDLKEQKQPIEQHKILSAAKAYSEQNEKSIERAKEDPVEKSEVLTGAKVLGSVVAHQEELKDKREEPIEHSEVLSSVSARQERPDFKKQATEQLKILDTAKINPEDIEKKQQEIDHVRLQSSVKPQKQDDLKDQTTEEAQVLNTVKIQETPVEKKQRAEAKVLGSVVAHQEELKDKREEPIEHSEVLSSVSAHQERPDLKKQATEQLKFLDTAKINPEKIEKKEQAIDHVRLLSSVKPQKQDDLKDQTIEEAQVLSTVKIQEAPAEKTETAQPEPKPEPEDPNEFRKELSSTAIPLPKIDIDEKLPLSVLLERIRQRNKIETCQDLITRSDPVGKKCGCPPPPCPPPAPTCPPPKPCPPPPCPPPPPPCPKPCKPACPNPCGPPKPCCPPKKPPCCSNYIQVDTDFDFAAILHETDVFLKKHMYETVTAILTKEVVMKLEKMGVSLLITYPNEEIDLNNIEVSAENTEQNSEDCQVNLNGVDMAKDYEPWVPIPSWPIPRKVKKRPLVCPKDGCKIIPPPRLNPPCTQNPCTGFPKRRNSFSTPDSADLSEDVSVRYES